MLTYREDINMGGDLGYVEVSIPIPDGSTAEEIEALTMGTASLRKELIERAVKREEADYAIDMVKRINTALDWLREHNYTVPTNICIEDKRETRPQLT